MPQDNDDRRTVDTTIIPVIEKTARISTRQVEAGRVRVHLRTEVGQQRLQATLRSEAVTVERRPIGRELAPGEPLPVPHDEEDGRVTVIPVLEEILVVEKRLVLREELRLRRTSSLEDVDHAVDVQRQHAEVERLPPADPQDPSNPGHPQ